MHSRFALAVAAGVVAITTIGAVSAAPQQNQSEQLQYFQPGNGVSYPILLRQEQPRYTADAVRQRIEGPVQLQAVVLANGTVGEVRVLKSLDQASGLDDAAIAAAKKWLFKPALKDGKPVPVIVTLIIEFRLDRTPRPQSGEPPMLSPLAPAPPDTTDEFLKGVYPTKTPGLVAPKLLKNVQPKYSADAMQAGISGVVEVEAVVLSDGKVARTRVTKSLDTRYGLDAAAVAAVEQWTFEPGKLNDQPVPVAITVVLEFRTK
jgi:TonB family protein